MLFYILCLQKLIMCSSQKEDLEEKSFYVCTRSDISNFSLQNYKKYELLDIENYNWKFPIFGSTKKDFYINKISYMIKPNNNLHLNAMNNDDKHVLDILITQNKNSLREKAVNIEFFRPNSNNGTESIKLQSFECGKVLDNDVYIVENNGEIMNKMKLAVEYVRLSNEISNLEKKNNEVFESIGESLKSPENKKIYLELHWKLKIFFFVISESKLADPLNNFSNDQNDLEKNFTVYDDQILENKINYNMEIVYKIIRLNDELEKLIDINKENLVISRNKLLEAIEKVKSELKSIKKGMFSLYIKIKDLNGDKRKIKVIEKSFAVKFTTELIDLYLSFQAKYDDLVSECEQSNPNNNLNFCRFDEILKIFTVFQNGRSLKPHKKLQRLLKRF